MTILFKVYRFCMPNIMMSPWSHGVKKMIIIKITYTGLYRRGLVSLQQISQPESFKNNVT